MLIAEEILPKTILMYFYTNGNSQTLLRSKMCTKQKNQSLLGVALKSFYWKNFFWHVLRNISKESKCVTQIFYTIKSNQNDI